MPNQRAVSLFIAFKPFFIPAGGGVGLQRKAGGLTAESKAGTHLLPLLTLGTELNTLDQLCGHS